MKTWCHCNTQKQNPHKKQQQTVRVSPLSLVLIMRLTPGLMLEEEAAVTITVYCVPGLTFTTSAYENSKNTDICITHIQMTLGHLLLCLCCSNLYKGGWLLKDGSLRLHLFVSLCICLRLSQMNSFPCVAVMLPPHLCVNSLCFCCLNPSHVWDTTVLWRSVRSRVLNSYLYLFQVDCKQKDEWEQGHIW